jgi:hypothetical protein
MQYPSMPFYIPRPKRAPVYSYMQVPVQEKPTETVYPQLQAFEVIMPMQKRSDNDADNESLQAMDTMGIILLVIAILFIIWDVVLTVCNLSTFIYLLKHPTLFIVLIVLLFGISMVGKLGSFVIAMAVVLSDTQNNVLGGVLTGLLVTCGVCTAGFVGFMLWSWTNLSLGTNIALILDFVGYLATTVLALIVNGRNKPSYEYVTVQRFPRTFQP